MTHLKIALAVSLACALMTSAHADDAKMLQISGAIEGGKATYSYEDLTKLGTTEVTTSTPWTPKTKFEGVALSRLLDAVHVSTKATTISVKALDGYTTTIPIPDVRKWPVILAYKADGKRMTIETKGPLWVVYPLDEFPESKTSANMGRMAWATVKLSIQ